MLVGRRVSLDLGSTLLYVARTVSSVLSRVVVCHRADGLEASQD